MMSNFLKVAMLSAFVFSAIALCPELKFAADSNQINRVQFRVVRSICGSRGSQQGDRFVIDDARSVFYLPEDRQVVVYLELEGPVGNHRIEGFWKNPAGKVAAFSDFSYASKERIFSSHFTFAILESAAMGAWALEVHIDGEFVSEVNFQITAGARASISSRSQKLLSPAEIYQRAATSTVTIERIGKNQEVLGASSGFIAGPGILISAFESIDGVSSLRVTFPSGRRQETDRILSWSRQKGYSVIGVDIDQTPALPFTPENSWQVGDNATFLEVTPEGYRVASGVKIVGKDSHLLQGDRIILSSSVSERARGGALLNDYGEVIGIVDSFIYTWVVSSSAVMRLVTGSGDSGIAIPLDLVGIKQTTLSTLEKLTLNGDLLPPVSGGHILDVQLLVRSKGKIGISVIWNPKEKLKGVSNIFIYDNDNKVLGPSDKRTEIKVNFRPGQEVSTSWAFDSSSLSSGIYRIDVQINGIPYWRTFFRKTD
jgi:S1-C subfamily serine protease